MRYLTVGVLLPALVAACSGSVSDPPPRREPRVDIFDSPLGMENTYRRLYAKLRECIAGGVYTVEPTYDHQAQLATVHVSSGLGLNRYLVFSNRYVARFDIRPAKGGSEVAVSRTRDDLDWVLESAQKWLRTERPGC